MSVTSRPTPRANAHRQSNRKKVVLSLLAVATVGAGAFVYIDYAQVHEVMTGIGLIVGQTLGGREDGVSGRRSAAVPVAETHPGPTVQCAAGDLRRLEQRVRAVAQAVLPTVVAVGNHVMEKPPPGGYQSDYASGVIVTADGIVLSQRHVTHVDQSSGREKSAGEKTTVILHDGRECPAVLLGASHTCDVSLLRLLPPGPYPYAPIRPTTQARLGEWVLKIGHPLGYRKDRSAPVRLGRVLIRTEETCCTDCALSGGDSGGPYFTLDGELLGVVRHSTTYLDNGALKTNDQLLIRRTTYPSLSQVAGCRLIHHLFDSMMRGDVPSWNGKDDYRIDRSLAGAETLRVADWSQGSATLAQYRSIVAPARSSVVIVLNTGVAVALGTVVGAEGWVVTKASALPPDPTCRLSDGRILAAQVVGADPVFDLALLKVPGGDLHPIPWAERFDPPVGTLLAAVGPQEQPLATGVVSVPRRDLADPFRPTYTLPIRVAAGRPAIFVYAEPKGGFSASRVCGLAWAAGVRPDDLLRRVDGRSIRAEQDLIDAVKGRLSGDVVSVDLERGGKAINLQLPLGPESGSLSLLDLNYRADGFPTVFECAVPFFSHECGGPIVDLNGRAVGVTIARVGRHGGMAIPGDCVLRLLPELKSGRLAKNWVPDKSAGK
jgi:serine protease Do